MAANDTGSKSSTIQIEYRSGRAPGMFMLQKLLKPFKSQLTKFDDPETEESPEVKLPSSDQKKCTIQERRVNDLRVYDFSEPKHQEQLKLDSAHISKKRVIYFAGGGWQVPPTSQHISLVIGLLERMPHTTISLVSYPLAPNFAAPKAFPKLCELYTTMLNAAQESGEKIVIAGDSAGGNLALCLPLYMLSHRAEVPAPAAIMALSPSTDLRRQNPVMPAVAKHDPLLTIPFIKSTADKWRGNWDAFDPRVSPLAADVTPLVDRGVAVHGLTGTYDILSLDAIIFRTKLAEAGVRGRWLEWDRQMHVWLLVQQYGFKDAKGGLDWMAETLNGV